MRVLLFFLLFVYLFSSDNLYEFNQSIEYVKPKIIVLEKESPQKIEKANFYSKKFYTEYSLLSGGGYYEHSVQNHLNGSKIIFKSKSEEYLGSELKIGYGGFFNNRHELLLQSAKFKSHDYQMESFWYQYVFTFSKYFAKNSLPFVLIGVGSGSKEFEDDSKDISNEKYFYFFGSKYGVGAYYLVNKNLQFKISYEFIKLEWQDIKESINNNISITTSTTTHIEDFNLGIIYYF